VATEPSSHNDSDTVEMPRPTAAPLVLSVGLMLLAVGAVTSIAFLVVGGGLFFIGLAMWMAYLLPGRGHTHEPRVEPAFRPAPVTGEPGQVERLRVGAPGYRMRLPERVHPISAGVKGGIVGGIVMPLAALSYGVLSGHGLWYPVNLLAGMVLPGIDQASTADLEKFSPTLLLLAVAIHAVMSLVLGMIYGVLLPTLPDIPKPLAWGALLAPMLWTAVSFAAMGMINPALKQGVDWFWFIMSQFIFGVILATVMMLAGRERPLRAAAIGALAGALLMPLPAMVWGYATGHGIWYPVNLLAGVALPGIDKEPTQALSTFRGTWFVAASVIHLGISLTFGVLLGLLLPRLPRIAGPLAWGGMLLPLVWTAISYSMMGVVNPALEERVDWPWFIVSQIIFGVAAAIVVVRSEMVHVPPAGSDEALDQEEVRQR
jgi:hypothetical protein